MRFAADEAAAKTPTGPAPSSAIGASSMAGSALSGEDPSSTMRASGFGAMPYMRARLPRRSASLVTLRCSLLIAQRKFSADILRPLSGVAISPFERRGWRSTSTVTLTPDRASNASARSAL